MKSPTNYSLLDGARMNVNLFIAKEMNSLSDSLYVGNSKELLADVAPYLFSCSTDNDFTSWYIKNGWGNAWGIIISTTANFEDCHKHFRKFLLVKTEDNRELYFRFYDPRVLKIFLPTCTKSQLIDFFGPIDYFIVEGDDKNQALKFSLKNGILKKKIISIDNLFSQELFTLPTLKKHNDECNT